MFNSSLVLQLMVDGFAVAVESVSSDIRSDNNFANLRLCFCRKNRKVFKVFERNRETSKLRLRINYHVESRDTFPIQTKRFELFIGFSAMENETSKKKISSFRIVSRMPRNRPFDGSFSFIVKRRTPSDDNTEFTPVNFHAPGFLFRDFSMNHLDLRNAIQLVSQRSLSSGFPIKEHVQRLN